MLNKKISGSEIEVSTDIIFTLVPPRVCEFRSQNATWNHEERL